MAIQLQIKNAQQISSASLSNAQELIVKNGNVIRIQDKANYKLYKNGNNLIIKSKNGEEFILKDFYKNAEDPTQKQVLSWDDEGNQHLEASSRDDQNDPNCVPVTEQGAATEAINSVITGESISNAAICARQQDIVALTQDAVVSTAAATGATVNTFATIGTVIAGVTGAVVVADNVQKDDKKNTTNNDNAPNIIDASVTLNENILAGTAVTNVSDSFTTTDFDRDGDAINYSITGGNAAGIFAIDSSTGAITIAAGKTLDYETASSHSLTVTADDGTLSDTAVITINVTNLDEVAPTITSASSVSINENIGAGQVVYTVTATDNADTSAGISYSLSGTDAGLFSIDSGTGAVTLTGNPNYESKTSYSLTVEASDGVNTASTQAVTINVQQINVDLVNTAAGIDGFVINGTGVGANSGWQVSNAGDVNGDGLDDVIIGEPNNGHGGANAGSAYVVFGKTGTVPINLSDIGTLGNTEGFEIQSVAPGALTGYSVSAAGDVNGDGLADLIVGSPHSNTAGGVNAGAAFVVFGKTDSATVFTDVISAGTGGFVILGAEANANGGLSVSAAGDVNGDGKADLLVGSPNSDSVVYGSDVGATFVVFGKNDTLAVDVTAIGSGVGGFQLIGTEDGNPAAEGLPAHAGASVSVAGDVNGDGLADFAVGMPYAVVGAYPDTGAVSVVFGKADNTIEVNAFNIHYGLDKGFDILGEENASLAGSSVSAVGDINGDGYADLFLGAPNLKGGAPDYVGRGYIVFGKTDYNYVVLGSGIYNGAGDLQSTDYGFAINGEAGNGQAGFSVANAGDMNGDGLADLIISAPYSDPVSGTNAGRSYVVYGKTGLADVNLSDVALGNGGFVINGQAGSDQSGYSVSAAGDVNGDGFADLIVGAPGANSITGRSYVIFGGSQYVGTTVDIIGTSGADSALTTGTAAAETIVAGDGNDIITGNGGADVLYGGRGNDTFVLNDDNIAKLTLGVTDGQLARIDGGTGVDTISLLGSGGINLNLTSIGNQAAGNPDGGSRIDSIEKIDITGSGNNILTIGVKDVLDMSGMNLFNNGSSWTGLGASVDKHQVVVDGDTGDTANLAGGWTDTGTTATYGANTYQIYNASSSAAQILVDTDIARFVI